MSRPTPFDDGDLYDLLFHGFDYGVDFYVEQARASGGPVLDLACGTGRVLLPMLRAGVDADGVDLSPAMLEAARRKTAGEGFAPALIVSPMAAFRMPRRYALIVIPFNSFVHNLTRAEQVGTLRSCREHLRPGGRLLFDIAHVGPTFFAQPSGEPVLELEISDPATGNRVRNYDTRTLDLVEQLQHSENETQILSSAGELLRSIRTCTSMRWFFKPEVELLLEAAGFSRWEIARAFDGGTLSGATEPVLVSAWS
jgi:SAM-dependent methyltransferase